MSPRDDRRVRAAPALLTGFLWLAAATAAALPSTAGATPAAGAATNVASQTAALDIRDIRPPYEMPRDWLWMTWLGGAGALVALGVVWWRRRAPGRAQKSLQESVLESLESTQALLRAGDPRGFAIAVSGIIRSYVERKFSVRAMHRTTVEFLQECLTSVPILRRHQRSLNEFLGYCDLAKFARWALSTPEMEGMLVSAVTFVRESGSEAAMAVPPMAPASATRAQAS